MTSDDRVRGGSSTSHLTVLSPERARFHGNLDTSTLGGAGFASQHTLDGAFTPWDLSDFEGLLVSSTKADGRRYVIALKDENPGKRPDGREKSSLSWEADFVVGKEDVVFKWEDFKPTYRGREQDDADPLDLSKISRVTIMMRR